MKGIDIKADKNRTLRFTINSMIQVKRDKKKDFASLVTELGQNDSLDIELLRYLYYVGLKWEDADLTEEQVGDIMDTIIENEGINGLAQYLSDAIAKALGSQGDPDPNRLSH